MKSIDNYLNYLKVSSDPKGKTYLITGVNRNGGRFRLTTKTPENYNVFNGCLWLLNKDGKRKLLNRFIEGVKI